MKWAGIIPEPGFSPMMGYLAVVMYPRALDSVARDRSAHPHESAEMRALQTGNCSFGSSVVTAGVYKSTADPINRAVRPLH